MSTKPSPASSVKSAARALDIIEEISRRGSLTAREISRATHIPESSLSYLLTTLVNRSWLTPLAGRSYCLGPALSRLVLGTPPTIAERRSAMIRQIVRDIGETTSLFTRRSFDVEVIDVELSTHTLRFTPLKGLRVPMHSFAAGKALLAAMPDEEFEAYLAAAPRMRFTAHTLVGDEEMREDRALTRQRGYALAREEHTAGVVGIAVALDGEQSLSVALPTPRDDSGAEKRIAKAIFQALDDYATPHTDDGG